MKSKIPFVFLALGLFAAGGAVLVRAATQPEHLPALTTSGLEKLRPLVPTEAIRPTGKLREFTLTARPGRWELVDGIAVDVWAYNGQVPGPLIRVTEGDRVRVTLINELPEPTTIHWHGGHVPNDVDGVAPFTQRVIGPGQRFTYEFTAWHAGTFMYHTHYNSIKQTDMGLYGPLIIDPQDPSRQPQFDRDYTLMIGAWIVNQAAAGSPQYSQAPTGSPAQQGHGSGGGTMMHGMHGMHGMQGMAGMPGVGGAAPQGLPAGGGHGSHGGSAGSMGYNYFTINGKAFPDTQPLPVRKGERVRVRLINISNLLHPMHLHGHDFRVIAIDGHPIAEPFIQNTIDVEPGRTYDIEFIADNPCVWVFHCHELHHTANGDVEPGGLITLIQYEDFAPPQGGATPGKGGAPSHGGISGHGH